MDASTQNSKYLDLMNTNETLFCFCVVQNYDTNITTTVHQ